MAFIFKQADPQVTEITQQLKIHGDITVNFQSVPGSALHVVKHGNSAEITYGCRAALFRGLGLLAEHSAQPEYKTTQTAKFSLNGAMLDCSRNGVVNLNAAKQMIRYLALMGHNTLMFYTEDTYEIPEYPYFGHLRGRYSQKELRELDDYAAGYGIELIPCIQTLAHLATTLRWQCFDGIKDNEDILLVGEEKTYEFIEAMIRACRNSYRTKRILIGMDEAFMLGFGRYRLKHGIRSREEIFCEHLQRVNEICRKYGFRAMIWSDMFYRIAFDGNYAADGDIPEHVINMVPDDVELVYWEYERNQKQEYYAPLKSHKQFRNNILFAGSAWRWLSFAPHTEKSLDASRAALAACKEMDIREVFCTAWGDQGNETPVFSILATLQLFAELSYTEDVSQTLLAQRLYACTGEQLSDILLLDAPDMPDGKYRRIITNPSSYLLYSDVMAGLFEMHAEDCYRTNYAQYAKALDAAALRSQRHSYMYRMLARLCDVLALKSCVGADMYKAYQAGDRESLHIIANETLPEILNRLDAFRSAVEVRWLAEYKVSGFDVIDFRLGGVCARVQSASRRINAYLNGHIDSIPELEEPRLPFHCVSEEELEKERVICWNIRKDQYTANNI